MISTQLYEKDPTLEHRWIEKVPIEELDYWNLSAGCYFGSADFDESTPLEDRDR